MQDHHFACAKDQGVTETLSTPRPTIMPGGCPKGYMTFESKCFQFVEEKVDWGTAHQRCYDANKPYGLASIKDAYDQCEFMLF